MATKDIKLTVPATGGPFKVVTTKDINGILATVKTGSTGTNPGNGDITVTVDPATVSTLFIYSTNPDCAGTSPAEVPTGTLPTTAVPGGVRS